MSPSPNLSLRENFMNKHFKIQLLGHAYGLFLCIKALLMSLFRGWFFFFSVAWQLCKFWPNSSTLLMHEPSTFLSELSACHFSCWDWALVSSLCKLWIFSFYSSLVFYVLGIWGEDNVSDDVKKIVSWFHAL